VPGNGEDPRWSIERHEAQRVQAEDAPPSAWAGWVLVALTAAVCVSILLAALGLITLPDWVTDTFGGGGG
jgi:hypothetical protein